MAGLPTFNLIKLDNQLGNVLQLDDSRVAMLGFGPATTGAGALALATPMLGNTLADFEARGLTAAYDTANSTNVHAELKEFYRVVQRRPLYFMLVTQATTLTQALDPTNTTAGAARLLDFVNGNAILSANRRPPGAYNPTYTDGVDPDVVTAVANAKLLRDAYVAKLRPCTVVVGGRGLKGQLANVQNLDGTGEGVFVNLLGVAASSLEANNGLVLGWVARSAVHERQSKTERGPIPVPTTQAYLTNGLTAETAEAAWTTLHNRGFVFPRTFPLQAGYYLSSDRTAASSSSDFLYLSACRVMDKALVLTYLALFNLIDQDHFLEAATGQLPTGTKRVLEGDAVARVLGQMALNVSSLTVTIEDETDLLGAETFVVRLAVQPKGYSSQVTLRFGFSRTTA